MAPEGSSDAPIAAIQREFAKIERDHDVRILYAAESGSRAWGFPSPDSDYDIRFIYLHPLEWYVSLTERRDVIEVMAEGDLDISGWDLRKALRLFLKSNPSLHEWLVSPIVYRDDTGFADVLRGLATQGYSLRAVGASYLNWARRHEARHLRDRDEVSLKKYLYVIRPLTAISWLESHGALPPMNLREILAGIRLSSAVEAAIDTLLAEKQMTSEMGTGPRISVLDEWIGDRLLASEAFVGRSSDEAPPSEEVDRHYRALLGLEA